MNLEMLIDRAHSLGGTVQLFETQQGLWTAGLYFYGGRRYEWAAASSMMKALSRAIEITEKETCYGLA